ncbi:MAG: hypothetical protein P1U34_09910 [Coxiellaceae bacterium]|nr:hypothetical protein [Coxiellaceae bacterium]
MRHNTDRHWTAPTFTLIESSITMSPIEGEGVECGTAGGLIERTQ